MSHDTSSSEARDLLTRTYAERPESKDGATAHGCSVYGAGALFTSTAQCGCHRTRFGFAMSIGYPAVAYADGFTDEATAHSDADDEIETTSALTREDNDIGPDVALLTGAATAAPYLTAPAFFLANAAVG